MSSNPPPPGFEVIQTEDSRYEKWGTFIRSAQGALIGSFRTVCQTEDPASEIHAVWAYEHWEKGVVGDVYLGSLGDEYGGEFQVWVDATIRWWSSGDPYGGEERREKLKVRDPGMSYRISISRDSRPTI